MPLYGPYPCRDAVDCRCGIVKHFISKDSWRFETKVIDDVFKSWSNGSNQIEYNRIISNKICGSNLPHAAETHLAVFPDLMDPRFMTAE